MKQDLPKSLLHYFAKNAYQSQQSFNFETCVNKRIWNNLGDSWHEFLEVERFQHQT
jgi:hypothetical protein